MMTNFLSLISTDVPWRVEHMKKKFEGPLGC
jgi:hypothetical protein